MMKNKKLFYIVSVTLIIILIFFKDDLSRTMYHILGVTAGLLFIFFILMKIFAKW